MPRKRRRCPGGLAYHVFNRATARERIFDDAADYLAFERVLAEARERLAGRKAGRGGKRDGCDFVYSSTLVDTTICHGVLEPGIGTGRFLKG